MGTLSPILLVLNKLKFLDTIVKLRPGQFIIACYHNVGPLKSTEFQTFEKPFPVELLKKQIQFLLRNNYRLVSLSEALELISKGHKKIFVLSFDDGYKGIYRYVFPILIKYRVKATIYLTAGFVKYEVLPWMEQLYHIVNSALYHKKSNDLFKLLDLEYKPKDIRNVMSILNSFITNTVASLDVCKLKETIYNLSKNLGIKITNSLYREIMLTVDEIKEMIDHGIEVGGHGLWHVNLTLLNKDRLREEVFESLNFVKSMCTSIPTFAYPFGAYNKSVVKYVRDIGFKAAVTVDPHINSVPESDIFRLGRIPPYGFGLKDLASFKYLLIDSQAHIIFDKLFRWSLRSSLRTVKWRLKNVKNKN